MHSVILVWYLGMVLVVKMYNKSLPLLQSELAFCLHWKGISQQFYAPNAVRCMLMSKRKTA